LSNALTRSGAADYAIERLHEEFKRRIKTQTVLPSADTATMLFWAMLASGLKFSISLGRLSSRLP
jgi:putative transposase